MKNKQKGFVVPLILVIVAMIAVGGGVYLYQENKVPENIELDKMSTTTSVSDENKDKKTEEETLKKEVAQVQKCELVVTSLTANSKVSFPLNVRGTIDNRAAGCSWQMFEGQAGTAQLFFNYENKGWKPIGVSVPIKVADWAAKTTSFEVVLNFNNEGIGIPSGTPMKIVFTAENAAAIEPSKKLELPITLDLNTSTGQTGSVKIMLSDGDLYDSSLTIPAQVTLEDKSNKGRVYSAHSSNGIAVFNDILAGSYMVHIAASGFKDVYTDLAIKSGDNGFGLSVALHK